MTPPRPPSSPFKIAKHMKRMKRKRERKPTPVVTYSLVLANVTIFIVAPIMMRSYESVIFTFGFTPTKIRALENLHSLITHMFVHLDLVHIFMNMLVFLMFAPECERKMGSRKFLFFYLVCGILAIFTHFLFYFNSNIPVVGASGAIYGVLGAYTLLFPTRRVYLRLVPVPAILGIPVILFLQLLRGLTATNIAHFAHIGGFVAGVIVIRLIHRETAGFLSKLMEAIFGILVPEER